MHVPTFALSLAAVLVLAASGAPARAEGDVASGAKLFPRRCGICHGLTAAESKPTGPHLEKLFGRKAGSVEGFTGYSAGMKASSIVWDEKTLDQYLTDPLKMVPGSTMPAGAPKVDDREDIIAYLKSLPK